jgi:hypothetical protein
MTLVVSSYRFELHERYDNDGKYFAHDNHRSVFPDRYDSFVHEDMLNRRQSMMSHYYDTVLDMYIASRD